MSESIYKNDELENEVSLDMSYFWYSDRPWWVFRNTTIFPLISPLVAQDSLQAQSCCYKITLLRHREFPSSSNLVRIWGCHWYRFHVKGRGGTAGTACTLEVYTSAAAENGRRNGGQKNVMKERIKQNAKEIEQNERLYAIAHENHRKEMDQVRLKVYLSTKPSLHQHSQSWMLH